LHWISIIIKRILNIKYKKCRKTFIFLAKTACVKGGNGISRRLFEVKRMNGFIF